MRKNDQSNAIIKWVIIIGDIVLFNVLLWAFGKYDPQVMAWESQSRLVFILVCNLSLIISEFQFYSVIHQRLVTSVDINKRLVRLTMCQAILAYLLMKVVNYILPVGKLILMIGTLFFVALMIARYVERLAVTKYRMSGGNFRAVTLIGSDTELLSVYDRLVKDPTRGFRVLGYYGDAIEGNDGFIKHLGTMDFFMENLKKTENLILGDDVYVCISRKESETVKRISRMCEEYVIRFYYVPVSVESMGISLKREILDDMEIFTTYDTPLQNPANIFIKRLFDISVSFMAWLLIIPILPFIALTIKIQSPKGPVFFRQKRTGLDGKNFYCYKFRSMHPNKDEASARQATKDDPRKFPFGSFMRKTSIDELPQFWNVLKGDMSIVGPRPHPVAINEQYSKLIDKYMVRHFVKPGLTGWAQVTGYRGETEHLWQMEGRVKRDIWYMEHWSFLLDIRILLMTIKQIIMHDEQAY